MAALFPDLAPDPPEPPPPAGWPWPQVNRTQLAALLGVHPETVTAYVRNGMPVEAQGRGRKEAVYDAVACLKWWRGAQAPGGKKASAKDEAHEEALLAKAELDRLRAEEMKRVLIPRSEATADIQAFAKGVESQVRALPRRARQSGVIFDAQQEQGLSDLCRQICGDIAKWRSRHDVEAATEPSA